VATVLCSNNTTLPGRPLNLDCHCSFCPSSYSSAYQTLVVHPDIALPLGADYPRTFTSWRMGMLTMFHLSLSQASSSYIWSGHLRIMYPDVFALLRPMPKIFCRCRVSFTIAPTTAGSSGFFRKHLLTFDLLHSWSIIIGLVFVVLASLLAWVFAPKGENKTYALLSSEPSNLSTNSHVSVGLAHHS
jgi:hypothetical protein